MKNLALALLLVVAAASPAAAADLGIAPQDFGSQFAAAVTKSGSDVRPDLSLCSPQGCLIRYSSVDIQTTVAPDTGKIQTIDVTTGVFSEPYLISEALEFVFHALNPEIQDIMARRSGFTAIANFTLSGGKPFDDQIQGYRVASMGSRMKVLFEISSK